jgi:hypothetical protein
MNIQKSNQSENIIRLESRIRYLENYISNFHKIYRSESSSSRIKTSLFINLIMKLSNNFDDFKQKYNKFCDIIKKLEKDKKNNNFNEEKSRKKFQENVKNFLRKNLKMSDEEIELGPNEIIRNFIPEPNNSPIREINGRPIPKKFRFRNEEEGKTLANVREFEINLKERGENLGMSVPAKLKKIPVPEKKNRKIMSNEKFRKVYEDNPNLSKINVNNAKKKGNKMANPNWLNKEEEISRDFKI